MSSPGFLHVQSLIGYAFTMPSRPLLCCFITLIVSGIVAFFSLDARALEYGFGDRTRPVTGDARYAEVRVGRHADHIRIVFTTAEENVQKAAVTLMTTQGIRDTVKIEFPQPLVFVLPDRRGLPRDVAVEIDKGVKMVASAMTCRLMIDGLAHISVSRLTSPSRLAVNAYLSSPSSPVPFIPSAPPAVPQGPAPGGQPAPDQEGRAVTVVIDPGHGGYDKGIAGRDGAEKDVALALAKDLTQVLTRRGIRTHLTRSGDQGLSLADRTRLAASKSPALTLSIHVSSSKDYAVYVAPPPNQTVLRALIPPGAREENREMSRRYADAVSRHLRGLSSSPLASQELPIPLLLGVRGASLVLEVPHPDHFRYDIKGRERVVQAIAAAIMSVVAAPPQTN